MPTLNDFLSQRRRLIALLALLLSILIVISGCGWGGNIFKPLGDLNYDTKKTNQDGQATLDLGDKQLEVTVVDENNGAVENATLEAYEFRNETLVFAGNENYFPGAKLIANEDLTHSNYVTIEQLQPEIAVTTLTIGVITVGSIAYTIYEYYKNPGEIPLQIPGVIEGSSKVKSTCIRIDGSDIIAIGSIMLSSFRLYKVVKVLGAPAKLRGVTAMNYGFTKAYADNAVAEEIGTFFVEFTGILEKDWIDTCTYKYKTEDGMKVIPYLTMEIKRPSKGPRDLSGTWEGDWTNDAHGSSGIATMEISQQSDGTITGPFTDHTGGTTVDIQKGKYIRPTLYFELIDPHTGSTLSMTLEVDNPNHMEGKWHAIKGPREDYGTLEFTRTSTEASQAGTSKKRNITLNNQLLWK